MATLIGYFPLMAYWAYRVGIWGGPSQDFLPVVLVENKDWFPFVASDSSAGRLLLGRRNIPPSMVYVRVNYVTPWISNRVMVSNFRLASDGETVSSIFSGRLKLPWGTVDLVKPEVSAAGKYRLALERELGIGLLYENPNDLLAFQSAILKRQTKK